MFYVNMLKSLHKDEGEPSKGESQGAPTAISKNYANQVKEIVAYRVVPRRGNHPSFKEYLVCWNGLSDAKATWEHELNL